SLHCSMKLVCIDSGVEIACCPVQSRNDPAIVKRSALLEYFWFDFGAVGVEEGKPCGVPDLVGEVAIRLNLLFIPTVVSAAYLGERESRRVDAKFVEHVDRIDAVHLRLRHALALAVENCAGDENIREWFFADKLQSHHHHPRHPKEDDVTRCYQHGRRIESF